MGPGRKMPSILGGNRGSPERGGKGYMMGIEKERIGRGRKGRGKFRQRKRT
jgi:hypothetical protein